jgi:hypothetical protein
MENPLLKLLEHADEETVGAVAEKVLGYDPYDEAAKQRDVGGQFARGGKIVSAPKKKNEVTDEDVLSLSDEEFRKRLLAKRKGQKPGAPPPGQTVTR